MYATYGVYHLLILFHICEVVHCTVCWSLLMKGIPLLALGNKSSVLLYTNLFFDVFIQICYLAGLFQNYLPFQSIFVTALDQVKYS